MSSAAVPDARGPSAPRETRGGIAQALHKVSKTLQLGGVGGKCFVRHCGCLLSRFIAGGLVSWFDFSGFTFQWSYVIILRYRSRERPFGRSRFGHWVLLASILAVIFVRHEGYPRAAYAREVIPVRREALNHRRFLLSKLSWLYSTRAFYL